MIDELKQWEYDKGYGRGKADTLKVIDDIKTEICEALDKYEPIESQNHFDGGLSFALDIIDKHIKGVSECE